MGIGPSTCAYRNDCVFYKKARDTAAIMLLKELYCHGSPSKCEILKRWLRGKSIPTNMLPDGTSETTGEGEGDEQSR
jgi:hypothetical protein